MGARFYFLPKQRPKQRDFIPTYGFKRDISILFYHSLVSSITCFMLIATLKVKHFRPYKVETLLLLFRCGIQKYA